MTTRFIFDNQLKQQQDILTEIDYLTHKKPYPDKNSVHLARFVDSCFRVIEEKKLKEIKVQEEKIRLQKQLEFEQRKKAEEIARKQTLEIEAPSPTPEIPPLLNEIPAPSKTETQPQTPSEKKEYVLQIYSTPIGIVVDKTPEGKYFYQVVEPSLDQTFIEKAKELFSKEIEKDNSLIDKNGYIQKITEKTASKLNIPMNSLLPQQLHYYLERDILGANKFDPLLNDEKIKTIYCEGAMKPIKIEYETLGTIDTNITITNNDDLIKFLKRLLLAAGKLYNESNPIIDLTLQGLKFEGIIGLGGTNTKLTIRRLHNAT
jgi:hypothetical protein